MKILVCGSGQIGRSIAKILFGTYQGYATFDSVDINQDQLDLIDYPGIGKIRNDLTPADMITLFPQYNVVINALPHFMNKPVIEAAVAAGVDYFDLTEDVKSRYHLMKTLDITPSKGKFFMHCGLAPGLVSIIAGGLAKQFASVKQIKMRVGALPVSSANDFGYNVNWSVDGLINECNKACECVIDSIVHTDIEPLGGLEDVIIDGIPFEAFYTSGGAGTLTETYPYIEALNYKTLRYPGHLAKFKKYREERKLDELKSRLLTECPFNPDDVVYYLVSVIGTDANGKRSEAIVANKVKSNHWLSAIQLTTAYSLCGVVELYINQQFEGQSGLIKQENIPFESFKNAKLIKQSGMLP